MKAREARKLRSKEAKARTEAGKGMATGNTKKWSKNTDTALKVRAERRGFIAVNPKEKNYVNSWPATADEDQGYPAFIKQYEVAALRKEGVAAAISHINSKEGLHPTARTKSIAKEVTKKHPKGKPSFTVDIYSNFEDHSYPRGSVVDGAYGWAGKDKKKHSGGF